MIIFGLPKRRYIKMKKISPKKSLWIIGILAFFSGFLNFYIAFESSAAGAERIFQLVHSQLVYVLSEKDDMELIDWGNLLQSSNPGLGLTANLDGKTVLSIGKIPANPFQAPLGFHFCFPNDWSFHSTETLSGLSAAPFNFVLVLPLSPSPWSWAFLNGALALLVGIVAMILLKEKSGLKPASETLERPAPAPISKSAQTPQPPEASKDIRVPHLRMDKGYLIRFVSPGVSDLFHKEAADILERHILDLSPQPGLLEILKRGQNDKISDAFLPPLRLSASLLRDQEDWVILLEAPENGQKH